jgi:hypothetical protein
MQAAQDHQNKIIEFTTGKPQPVLPQTRSELRRLLASACHCGWARPLNEVISDLSKPLPFEMVSWFSKKGQDIPYIKWHDANMILDYIAPGWQVEIDHPGQVGDRVTTRATLSLLCAEGSFSRSSTGSDDLADDHFGGPVPDCESQAFRRAAARFGLGLYLYDKSVADALIARKRKGRT